MDTEDETLVGISSEDEAEDLDLDPSIAHQAVRWSVPVPSAGTSAAPSAGAGSAATVSTAATASTGTSTDVPQGPVPDEVVGKKSALLTMKRQVATLI